MEAGEYLMVISKKSNEKKEAQQLSFEDKVLTALNTPTQTGKLPRYTFAPTKVGNEIGLWCAGHPIDLPNIAYNFIKEKTGAGIISGNNFVLNIPRYTFRDKLYSDIRFCWQLGYIPIYINKELKSDDVVILGRIDTKLPLSNLPDKAISNKIKKAFNFLLKSDKDKAKVALHDLKIEFDELLSENGKKIPASILLAEINYVGKSIVSPIIILQYIAK
jgi:hypothetical protein